MKKSIQKEMFSVLEKVVRLEVEKNKITTPPICPFILHQPKRPKN